MSRIDPVFREAELAGIAGLSPEEMSAALASFAAEQIEDVKASNRQVAGGEVPFEVIVDGRPGAPLATVRPNGVVVANFDLVMTALEWIGEQLLLESPRLTGRFMRSWIMFADGIEVALGSPVPGAREYVFLNEQPYARKIDRGLSNQAPEGVVDGIAATAAKRYGNMAKIYPAFRALRSSKASEDRQPAIVVRPF